jgi:predicted restriction endonuclease
MRADNKQRLDVDNGILLSPVFDALFDKNYISFDESGKIVLSKEYSKSEYQLFGITGEERIKNLTSGNQKYLKIHRNKLRSKL